MAVLQERLDQKTLECGQLLRKLNDKHYELSRAKSETNLAIIICIASWGAMAVMLGRVL